MQLARCKGKLALLIITFGVMISWFWPQAAGATLFRKGFRVDAASSQTITFSVPANTAKMWLRLVTDPGIASLEFTIQPVVNGSPRVIKPADGPNQVLPVGDNQLNPIADAIYQFNTPAVNVYSITLDATGYPSNPMLPAGNWTLKVENKSSTLGVFALYISDIQSETEGANVWLRDNATVDPSGHHTLANTDNLDVTQTPTPSEWWKSPAIRFTDQSGLPTKNPVQGQNNNIYIKVHNFGTLPVTSVTIEAWWTHASAGLPPFGSAAWNPLGSQTISDIAPGTSKETPAFVWQNVPVPSPSQPNHYCIFARTTSSVGPLDPINYSSTVVDWQTQHNTNATHRNVIIIPTRQAPPAGPFPFFFSPPIRLFLNNPYQFNIVTDLRIKGLPASLRSSEILFQQLPEDNFKPIGLQRLESPRPPEGPAAREGVKTRASEGTTAPALSGMAKFGIVDNENLGLSNIILKRGEKRLVEINLAASEPMTGAQSLPIDVVQLVEGKPVGGVMTILDFVTPEKPEVANWWYWIILLVILVAILAALRKKFFS